MMFGSSIPHPWSAPVPVRQSNAQTWLVGPNTDTAQAIPASSGDCACTWSPPCTACPSGTRSPEPRPTNAKSCSTCSTMTRVIVEQVEQDLAFVGLGSGERVPDGQAVQGGDQVQAQSPEEAGMACAVSVFGPTSQV